jgi:hypothetical protein
MPVIVERPPQTRGEEIVAVVVGDHETFIAHPYLRHEGGESVRAQHPAAFFEKRCHRCWIADRAVYVRSLVAIALPRINDANPWIIKVRRNPFCGH